MRVIARLKSRPHPQPSPIGMGEGEYAPKEKIDE